ncbi:hypothetical protein [Streptomyces xantholiticus]|uniref:LPXTG cell wall anchor domain-containing protein n=1 Tax=Streptomyces xantholiticus TaxID=68285 RepID=A0ABV1UZW4_9ACTN
MTHNAPDDRDLFSFRRPEPALVGVAALSAVEAAHLAGFFDGPAAASTVALGGLALLVGACVYRRR